MSTYLAMEVRLVWMSFVLGCILMASYDLLRWFRFFVPHGLVWTGIEDFFYWICAAVMTFLLLFYENSGIVRAYVIACVFFGMIFYDKIISRKERLPQKREETGSLKCRNKRSFPETCGSVENPQENGLPVMNVSIHARETEWTG